MSEKSAYKQITERFVRRPQVDVLDEDYYRVFVPGWHVHNGASHGEPSGHGKTLDSACKKLLYEIDRPSSMLAEGQCDWQCRRRYDASPASGVAHEEFKAFLKSNADRAKAIGIRPGSSPDPTVWGRLVDDEET